MRKSILLLLILLCYIAFQFQGCGDEINNIIAYDTTSVVFIETTVIFLDTIYYSFPWTDNEIRIDFWLFKYSNNENITFNIDSVELLHQDSVYNRIFNHIWGNEAWTHRIDYDIIIPSLSMGDRLNYDIHYRIVEYLGVSDTGLVYDIRRDSSIAGWFYIED